MATPQATILAADDDELSREGSHAAPAARLRNCRREERPGGDRRFDLVLLNIIMPRMDGLSIPWLTFQSSC
jgi:hypothetical protein